ncbi:Ankyrin repeat and zinc finger domain-containing protein 1 [Nymphaea thermarum]|nr:Ankyrin repeat and zinc finger domain-containing protein 1 [Nymphaea thermarum]
MATGGGSGSRLDRASLSVFGLPCDFFDGAYLFGGMGGADPAYDRREGRGAPALAGSTGKVGDEDGRTSISNMSRWSCNTCRVEFESLEDQRSHFKSDLHRFNVKLSVAGKNTISEDDFDELGRESSLKDYEISSISGSDEESDHGTNPKCGSLHEVRNDVAGAKKKLMLTLPSGEIVSVWKCLLLSDKEDLLLENDSINSEVTSQCAPCLQEIDVIKRLTSLVCEPHNGTYLRIVLLISGGHFAGCVFDGDSIVAHKTFHRYVVRAKSGKKQSAKDATGKAANSAGASLRRHNEAALKRDISELLNAWKPYFGASKCIFLHAPSNNREFFVDNDKSFFHLHENDIRHVPLTVRRPTLKEAKRVYDLLTRITYEEVQTTHLKDVKDDLHTGTDSISQDLGGLMLENHLKKEQKEPSEQLCDNNNMSMETENGTGEATNTKISQNNTTPLHEAVKSGNAQKTLELLEQGLDPCIKDERGKTPYMVATDKEVRNTFRRFMALNLEKWDWHAANVPSPLTKELEESQVAKQAEKDAKRKARAKELKKLRKAKEKAQAQSAVSQAPTTVSGSSQAGTVSNHRRRSNDLPSATSEEEKRAALAAEREKRAAAAEKRIAEARNGVTGMNTTPSHDYKLGEMKDDVKCSCCMASLAGKVPFHRYHYKYCSTSCMHVHREMLEDS